MSNVAKIIFFDVGNVFLTYDHVFDTVQKDLGLDKEFFRSYDKYDNDAMLGKLLIPDIWQKVCHENNRTQDSKYKLIQSWVSDYEPIVPMHQLAKLLKSKYELAILSNLYIDFWSEISKQNFVPPEINFSPVIISAEVGYIKPDPQIYELAEVKSGFTGAQIFFIDDKAENIDEATRHGWQTFLFDYTNPEISANELQSILI